MAYAQQLILTQEPPKISRDEMNLAEFPLTILSTRPDPKTKTLEFSDSIRTKNGDLINRKWIITAADKFGLPTASDDEVLLGLLKLTVDDGMKSPKIFFTRYEMLKTLKWTTEGRSYSRLQKALDRLSGVRIKATNAFYDNESKAHRTKNFGILDAYEINDGRDNENKKSFFIWSEVIFKSFQVGFIKKLDLDFYLDLKSAISKRIYRFLDKHFWYKSRVQLNLFTFAHEKIGVSRNYRYVSSIRQQLDPAIEELIASGFLAGCEYIGKGIQADIVLYSGKSKPRVLDAGKKQAAPERQFLREPAEAEHQVDDEDIFAALLSRGIKGHQAEKILKGKDKQTIARVKKIIQHFDDLHSSSSPRVSKNPVGFLYRAVEKPYEYNLPGETGKRPALSQPRNEAGQRSELRRDTSVVNQEADCLEKLKTEYLVVRKQKIFDLRATVEKEMLLRMQSEVRAGLKKLEGLISKSRFDEAVEHGVDEKLAKLFAISDFEEWLRLRRT